MVIFLNILLCLLVVLAQATFSSSLSIYGIQPDMCFVLACATGFLSGEYKGLLIGLTVGLFQDLLAPGGIGLNMILKGLAGALAGITTHTISTVTGPAVLVVTLALSIGCGLASLVVAYPVVDALMVVYSFTSVILPHGVYNSVLTLGVFWAANTMGHSIDMIDFGRGHR
jgi:hypothetical protein